jgi:tetratricopeptide (TPR) repeat protein
MNDANRALATQIGHALTLHRSGDLGRALEIYRQLAEDAPNEPRVLSLFGAATLQFGRTIEGLELLTRSLELEPDQPRTMCNVAAGLSTLNRLHEALDFLGRAIALEPAFAGAHYQRAITLRDLGRLDEALLGFSRAIALDESFAEALNGRGDARRELGQLDEALEDFDRAVALRPEYADAHYNRGVALQDLKRLEASLVSYGRALELNAEMADAYNNRGRALRALNRPQEALADYERAIALRPAFAQAFNNRGVALKVLRRTEEARASYERAIALQPGFADAHWNLGLLHLLAGNFDAGWKLYEWRWKLQPARSFARPLWLGEQPITGKTLLVHAEQGLGDGLQFCRYIPLLGRLGCRIVVEVPAALLSVISTLMADFRIVERGDPLPEFDFHCPIMSLPLAFNTRMDSIPAATPYLFASTQKCLAVRRMLGVKTRPRVGLVWSGVSAHEDDPNRSLELASLQRILDLPIEFHSLQKKCGAADQAALRRFPQVLDHHLELADFSDTAALISEMDLVISVDTAVAHLAGALGQTVWILLPYSPDFRWLLDRSDSPWYPTATLFRQAAPGDWAGAVAHIEERLLERPGPSRLSHEHHVDNGH